MPKKKKKPKLEHYRHLFNTDTNFGHPGFQTALQAKAKQKKKEY